MNRLQLGGYEDDQKTAAKNVVSHVMPFWLSGEMIILWK
jgi:hypothetical protein